MSTFLRLAIVVAVLSGCENRVGDKPDLGTAQDAGQDAAQDTGTVESDAGSVDAGDAGTIDTGATDLGAQDIGLPDIGPPDLGAADAGSEDAGPPPPVGRFSHTATLLLDGRVLVVGGARAMLKGGSMRLQSASIYDPTTGQFTATNGFMSVPRLGHTATLMMDGRVLVVGGDDGNGELNSAEIFDPATGTFTLTGMLATQRVSHVAHRLPSGDVLVVGGFDGVTGALSSAEIYNPSSGQFRAVASRLSSRANVPIVTELVDQRVLLAGGHNGSNLNDANIFDPTTEMFSQTGDLVSGRVRGAGVRLPDGRVLVAGGTHRNVPLDSVEIFDPMTGAFSEAGALLAEGGNRSAFVTDADTVMFFAGGHMGYFEVERYQVSTASVTVAASSAMFEGRSAHTATRLQDDRILFVGGVGVISSDRCDIYDVAMDTFTQTGDLLSN